MFSSAPIPFLSAHHGKSADWVAALQKAMPDEVIVGFHELSQKERANCKVAIVANPHPHDLHQLPQLQWVHSVWAGVERLVADLGDSGLTIVRLVDPQLAHTMAEAVLAWVLYLHRDMPAYARQQRDALWQPRPYVRAEHRTIGMLGLGALGEAAARRLQDQGFQLLGWSRSRKSVPGVRCYSGEAELDELLRQTDILVCLLPLTDETRGLLNAERLAMLPRGASVINFARGAILVQDDLIAALDQGALAHAVLDVFETEPLPASDPCWHHPHITVLPHCTAPTDLETASRIVATNIARWRNSGVLPVGVNLDRGY